MLGVDEMMNNIQKEFPDMTWVKRISFGGLLDVPDENGETKAQSPSIGMGVDLFSKGSLEEERLNISKALVNGKLPEKIRKSFDDWAGCIAGALEKNDYLNKINKAGFSKIKIVSQKPYTIDISQELKGKIISIQVEAHKI